LQKLSSGSQCPTSIPPTGPGEATSTRKLRRAGLPLRGVGPGPGNPRVVPLTRSFVSGRGGRYPESSTIYIGGTRKVRTPRRSRHHDVAAAPSGSPDAHTAANAHTVACAHGTMIMMTRIGRAGHTRLGTRPLPVASDRRGRRRPDILGRHGGTCAHDAICTRRICTQFFALPVAASSYRYLRLTGLGYCFWSHAGDVLVSYAPVPWASPDGEVNLKEQGQEHPAKPGGRSYSPNTANTRRIIHESALRVSRRPSATWRLRTT
jgi:hypothetical protein